MRAKARTALVALLLVQATHARAYAQGIVLRSGDGVRVEIKDEKELTGQYDIGADGRVLLPLIGLIEVAGRPFEAVQRELQSAYARELVNPVVRVSPLLRIAVLGEVRQPGLYLVDLTYQVGDILARAGGLAASADPAKIVVTRASGAIAARFSAESMQQQPLTLQSGDQLRVERRSWTRENMGILLGTAGSLAVAVITGMLLR